MFFDSNQTNGTHKSETVDRDGGFADIVNTILTQADIHDCHPYESLFVSPGEDTRFTHYHHVFFGFSRETVDIYPSR
jgi:hypothetical protein